MKPFANPQYRKRTAISTTGDECCLCGRQTAGIKGALYVPVDHELYEFVTEAEAAKRGDAVSYYPIGPECVKKWQRVFGGKAERLFLKENPPSS